MSLAVHRRPYDAFLSHAHVDRGFVDQIYRWLVEVAGLNIWYDAEKMTGGPLQIGFSVNWRCQRSKGF